ncbi:hypothetical protein RGUI_0315 [Rhodovulum sp. P5]|uniref:head-tail adaptor protein n=1 Tax=Rhodovulum sp. P5 TaxID=1564506 RepID=UPI0009C241BE|nr:head-tail adaptor protein [Rhodovulum sp. P5]ARE38456.1 hypothetical protein RGUI_0315 [Rhodovulum sp. P5]
MKRTPFLNRRLHLESAQRVPDGSGGFVVTWEALGSLWAEVTALHSTKRAGPEITVARQSFRIVVRSAPVGAPSRPEPGQRFREGNRAFVIRSVAELNARGRYLSCLADEEISI